MIFNKFNWVSAVESSNQNMLEDLQAKMAKFYAEDSYYFDSIDFTGSNWNKKPPEYDFIFSLINASSKVLEIGSGKANILKYHPGVRSKYTGLDFSKTLADKNSVLYPEANFKTFHDPKTFPFKNQSFDLVFSTFVLEHTVFPHLFIEECLRVLKPEGVMVHLFPDFVARRNMTSQKVGFTQGSGRIKFKRGKLLDAFFTFLDNKYRMPSRLAKIEKMEVIEPQFMVNLNPTCFSYDFYPDVDAVYITNINELILYLQDRVDGLMIPDKILKILRPKTVSILAVKKK